MEGRVTGGLNVPDHAVSIAPGATVRGRIFGRIVLIEGVVTGEVAATGRIDVLEGAHVEADLTAPVVCIAEGAWFTGHIDMRRAEAAARVARYRIQRDGDTKSPDRVRPATPPVN